MEVPPFSFGYVGDAASGIADAFSGFSGVPEEFANPETPSTVRTDRDQQGAAAIPTAQELAAEAAAAQDQPTSPGGGAGGGAGGMTSFEQEIMNAIQRREKAAEQDKWLALAQVGLNLMSSTNATPLGALGEAGIAGVEAARTARDQYDKDRMDLMTALEQSRQARAAAAAAAARSTQSQGLGLSAGAGRLLTQMSSDIDRLTTIVNDPIMQGLIASGDASPDQEIAYQDAKDQLAAITAARNSALYGSLISGAGAGDDLNIDAADPE